MLFRVGALWLLCLAFNSPSALLAESFFSLSHLTSFQGQVICEVRLPEGSKTSHWVLRHLLRTRSQTLLDLAVVEGDVRRLLGTYNFYNLQVKAIPESKPDCAVSVEYLFTEKFTYGLNFSGFYRGRSLVLDIGPFDDNFLGSLTSAALISTYYNNTLSLGFSLKSRRVLGSPWMAELSIQNNERPFYQYDERVNLLEQFRVAYRALRVLGGYNLRDDLSTGVGVSLWSLDRLAESATQETRFYWYDRVRIAPFINWGQIVYWDFLQEGYSFKVTVANDILNLKTNLGNDLLKVGWQYKYLAESTYSFFKRFLGSQQFALQAGVGLTNHELRPNLFNVGGTYHVRGFWDSQQVGNSYAALNLEWRQLLLRQKWPVIDEIVVQGVVFQDLAQVLSGPVSSYPLMYSVGAGLRINPLYFSGFLLSLDYALPITSAGIGSSALLISLGQFF